MSDSESECKPINVSSIGSSVVQFGTDGLSGIPENLLLNFLASVIIVLVFFILKSTAWKKQNKFSDMYRDSWITLIFRDAFDLIPSHELQKMRFHYIPLDRRMSFCGMMWHCFFALSTEDIAARCGTDAVQYLTFLKRVIEYQAVNTLVTLLFILPANYHGEMKNSASIFVKTTMGNIDFRKSTLIWIHLSIALFLVVFCFAKIRSFSAGLVVYHHSPWALRSVQLKEKGRRPITVQRIENYIGEILPDAKIEDIKLVYKYKKFMALNKKRKETDQALEVVFRISSTEDRRIFVKQHCWCCNSALCCKTQVEGGRRDKVNALTYYHEKAEMLNRLVADEINVLPEKLLRIAYVTFQRENSAFLAVKKNKRYLSVEDDKNWIINKAEEPANIIWENLSRRSSDYKCKTLTVNSLLLLLAVFLTTPAILMTNLKFESISSRLQEIVFLKFIPTLLVWLLTVGIAALVTYSSGFLDFETKSGMNRSIMLKTVLFLLITVVILPSLGLTSISAFFTPVSGNMEHRWRCLFLPDNGAFFITYVMTSAFIGNILQLLHLPEMVFCFVGALTAKSEAEKLVIRKSTVWDFSYGVQYSHCLVIFTIVIFYSLLCPLIAPFGFMYFVLKYGVDRYNICYGCSPSRTSYTVHTLAIYFMMFGMISQNLGLFFLLFVRGSAWSPINYASLAMTLFTIGLCVVSLNKLHVNCIPEPLLLPHTTVCRMDDYGADYPTTPEVYQPPDFQEFWKLIPTLDKYNNLVPQIRSERSESWIVRSAERASTCSPCC